MTDVSAPPQLLPVPPFDLIVFGAAGDLSLRKLIPSLFHRWRDGQIPEHSKIIGVSRTEMSEDAFRSLALDGYRKFHAGEKAADDEWGRFARQLFYVELDGVDAASNWKGLSDRLGAPSAKQRIFYLALPPSIYGEVSRNIEAAGLKTPGARIVLEKPIGNDLESAKAVNDAGTYA